MKELAKNTSCIIIIPLAGETVCLSDCLAREKSDCQYSGKNTGKFIYMCFVSLANACCLSHYSHNTYK